MRTIIVACVAVFALTTTTAFAQSWQPPADNQRCPSKWGPTDERGAANLMNSETVLRAARLIRTGEVIELGRGLCDTYDWYRSHAWL